MSRSILAYITNLLMMISALSLLIITTIGCSQDKPLEVTFQQLSSNPKQFNGRDIIVEGFYFQGFEVVVLSEDLVYSGYAQGHLIPEGITLWVEGGIPKEIDNSLYEQHMMGPSERYGKIRVIGRFQFGEQYGHLGQHSYQIIPLEVELLPWSPPAQQ